MWQWAQSSPFLTFIIILCMIVSTESVLVAFANSINRKDSPNEEVETNDEKKNS